MREKDCYRGEIRTDLVKIQNEKASHEENHFNRLPEELLHLLNKLSDLKSLFQCSLVSKHFASIVFRVRTVSVTSFTSAIRLINYDERTWESFSAFCKQNLKLPIFLENFRELEFIYLEYALSKYFDDFPFPKWKVKFSGDGSKIESFVVLLPDSVHKQVADQEVEPPENPTWYLECLLSMSLSASYRCYLEWMSLTCMLVKGHASLKRVTITDSAKKGKLVLRDEQLVVKIRSFHFEELSSSRNNFELARVPVLHLPLSGYVMKWAYLFICNPSDKKLDELTSWDFDNEEKILCEAIKEIFKNHRDKIGLSIVGLQD